MRNTHLLSCVIIAFAAVMTAGGAACAPRSDDGGAKLARDFMRAGIVLGKPLPKEFRIGRDTTNTPGLGKSVSYNFANACFIVDSRNRLNHAMLFNTNYLPVQGDLPMFNITTWTGADLLAIDRESLLKAYGEPTIWLPDDEEYSDTAVGDLCCYYYRKGSRILGIGFTFPSDGRRNPTVKMISILYTVTNDTSALNGKKLFVWPRG